MRGLPRFGREGPAHTLVDAPYWDGLRAGELRLQHCAACGRWIWGAQPMCPACHTFDPLWEAVEPAGVVFSWTRTHNRFHPSVEVPYLSVIVELPQAGGRRVLGLYAGQGDPVIGAQVHGEFEPAPDETCWPLLRWSPP
ncbi:MAG: Zn-ribbon domain-containing OB-fold protein [Sporichthyaceae bacterium]